MAWVHDTKEEAIELIEKWMETPRMRAEFVNNLRKESKFEIELILGIIDQHTNHIIIEQDESSI